MRRRTRTALLNIGLFAIALCLVLYSNRPREVPQRFSWTKVRYLTSTPARALPAARGVCPGLGSRSKPALVVARVAAEDAGWLNLLPARKYHLCIYTADGGGGGDEKTATLRVPANRGHEAMPFLTFIIDNYDKIPKAGAVFVHGSRYSWHTDHPEYDNLPLLKALDVARALAPLGYHNLRCDWSASTCAAGESAQGSVETLVRSRIEPWNMRAVSDAGLPRALASIFGNASAGDTANDESAPVRLKPGRGDPIRSQCCGQFVVSRERIWQHSRDEYAALRQWLLDGDKKTGSKDNDQAAPASDQVAGRIMSYLWHILFLPHAQSGDAAALDLPALNALACPSAADCYCTLYGRCELDCAGPGHCRGQYRVPANFELPGDWAAQVAAKGQH